MSIPTPHAGRAFSKQQDKAEVLPVRPNGKPGQSEFSSKIPSSRYSSLFGLCVEYPAITLVKKGGVNAFFLVRVTGVKYFHLFFAKNAIWAQRQAGQICSFAKSLIYRHSRAGGNDEDAIRTNLPCNARQRLVLVLFQHSISGAHGCKRTKAIMARNSTL